MDTSEKQFNARGHLALIVKSGAELSPETIMRIVFAADAMNRWQSLHSDGSLAKSINWHSQPKLYEVTEHTDREYRVEIRPPFLLTFEQLSKYIEYVHTLAQNMTGFHLNGVVSISARVDFLGTSKTFRV